MNDAPLALAFMLVALGLWSFFPPPRGSQLVLTRDVIRDVLLLWVAALALIVGTVVALDWSIHGPPYWLLRWP